MFFIEINKLVGALIIIISVILGFLNPVLATTEISDVFKKNGNMIVPPFKDYSSYVRNKKDELERFEKEYNELRKNNYLKTMFWNKDNERMSFLLKNITVLKEYFKSIKNSKEIGGLILKEYRAAILKRSKKFCLNHVDKMAICANDELSEKKHSSGKKIIKLEDARKVSKESMSEFKYVNKNDEDFEFNDKFGDCDVWSLTFKEYLVRKKIVGTNAAPMWAGLVQTKDNKMSGHAWITIKTDKGMYLFDNMCPKGCYVSEVHVVEYNVILFILDNGKEYRGAIYLFTEL